MFFSRYVYLHIDKYVYDTENIVYVYSIPHRVGRLSYGEHFQIKTRASQRQRL